MDDKVILKELKKQYAAASNRFTIASELVKVAHLLTGFLHSGSVMSERMIRKTVQRLQRTPMSLPERAGLFNQIDEIASRGQDSSGLTQTPFFRGWGREDFIKLNKKLRNRFAQYENFSMKE